MTTRSLATKSGDVAVRSAADGVDSVLLALRLLVARVGRGGGLGNTHMSQRRLPTLDRPTLGTFFSLYESETFHAGLDVSLKQTRERVGIRGGVHALQKNSCYRSTMYVIASCNERTELDYVVVQDLEVVHRGAGEAGPDQGSPMDPHIIVGGEDASALLRLRGPVPKSQNWREWIF